MSYASCTGLTNLVRKLLPVGRFTRFVQRSFVAETPFRYRCFRNDAEQQGRRRRRRRRRRESWKICRLGGARIAAPQGHNIIILAFPLVGASNVGGFLCRFDSLTQTLFVFRC